MKKKIKKINIGFDSSDFIKTYILEITRCLASINTLDINNVTRILLAAQKKNRTVYIIGNGGSASTASHMACDLSKGTVQKLYDNSEKRFRVVSLSDNTSVITALANDVSYDQIFIQQLANLLEKDDIVIAISASGNSKNVINAVNYAKKIGAITIGFLGFKTGGKLAGLVDHAIIVDSNQYGPVEDIHLTLNHIITSLVFHLRNTEINPEGGKIDNSAIPYK